MSYSEQDLAQIETVSTEILEALERVAAAVVEASGKADARDPANILGPASAGDAERAADSLERVRVSVQRYLSHMLWEPFVTRVGIQWEDGATQTFYITRGSAAGFVVPNVKLASQASPVGRLGELLPGESGWLPRAGKPTEYEIRERVHVRPVQDDRKEWDAVEDRFVLGKLRAALDSLRAFLRSRRAAPGDEPADDLLAALRAAADAVVDVRENLRRQVIDRMKLRDLPSLDQYQGEVARLPLDRQLLLLGPPGSGKTTTLIKRLAFKRHPEGLSEEEQDVLELTGQRQAFALSSGWVMFSPTDLLQLYLGHAFNHANVAAEAGRNLKTWERERRDLARNVLGILRKEIDGPGFALQETAPIVRGLRSSDLAALHDAFLPFAQSIVIGRVGEAFDTLGRSSDDAVAKASRELRARLTSKPDLTFREVALLLDLGSSLLPEVNRLRQQTEHTLGKMVSLCLRAPGLLEAIVAALPMLRSGVAADDEDEDDDEDESAPSTKEPRLEAAERLLAGLRVRARQLATGQRKPSARLARLLDLVGDRVPAEPELLAVGAQLVLMRDLRVIMRAPRRLVMGLPVLYGRFRRTERTWFREDVADAIRKRTISPEELDVLVLAMLGTARRLFQLDTRRLRNDVPDWLGSIRNRYVPQVYVDEATDFSSVQLACTVELSHPELRSWFACGDFRQRITTIGLRGEDELAWVEQVTGLSPSAIEPRTVSAGYRQSKRLQALAAELEGVAQGPTPTDAPEHGADVWPLLAEGLDPAGAAEWIASRIQEIGKTVGSMPSIAIFVDAEEAIDPLVKGLTPRLADQNIPVVACREGRDIGDRQEVRVFDVQHIKGLEFEAVFFVAIDALASRLPDLFDRFVYVGLTRAATYLAVTCEASLPEPLERVRGHFATGGWDT